MKHFKTFLLASIDKLDRIAELDDPAERHSLACGDIASQAGDMAARLGLPELHANAQQFGAYADAKPVKTFLSQCLATIESTKETIRSDLLPVESVASMIGVSASHVYRLADGGLMPRPVNIGASVRWVRSELDAWIKGGCKPLPRAK